MTDDAIKPATRHTLASLAHASVQQLRETLLRVAAATAADSERDEAAFLAGVDVSDSSWSEWEDTNIDVRLHGP